MLKYVKFVPLNLDTMDPNLLSLIIYLMIALVAACSVVAVPALCAMLRRGRGEGARRRGMRPPGFGGTFRVPFFLLAVLFMIFEIGILMIFPWALAFGWAVEEGVGLFAFVHLAVFALVFVLAMAFAFGSGALDWEG